MSQFQDRMVSLLSQVLGDTTIKQEINVRKLFPGYPSGGEHYDIVVPFFRLVVECHGEQHRTLVSFGKEPTQDTVKRLSGQKRRDRAKKEIALDNQWHYIAIWHDELPKDDNQAVSFLKGRLLNLIKEDC